MIQSIAPTLQSCWQKELAMAVSKPETLLKILSIEPSYFNSSDFDARKLFPVKVPLPFINKMEKGNPNDPLLLQVMPVRQEFLKMAGFYQDPLQEQSNQRPGLLHKYKSRVLILFRTGCAINCRYCFRRHFPYKNNHLNKQSLLDTLDYIANNNNINEVILSGGDPLMANDDAIEWFVDKLEKIPRIIRLRLHTRLPVVIPNRITEQLCQRLSRSRLQIVIVTHINHCNEIDQVLTEKLTQLKNAGITLLNQAVLLKGINDSCQAQVDLSESLFAAGILPYYLHLLDKVEGASHFHIEDYEASQLMHQMLIELPGFLVPKLVRESGGMQSKTPIDLHLD